MNILWRLPLLLLFVPCLLAQIYPPSGAGGGGSGISACAATPPTAGVNYCTGTDNVLYYCTTSPTACTTSGQWHPVGYSINGVPFCTGFAPTDKQLLQYTTGGSPNPCWAGGGTIYTNAEYSNGTCTTSATISPVNGNRQVITLTNADTCALTFTQPTSGTISIQIKVIQSSAGSFNGAISGGKWPGGAAPTITQTSGAVDIVTCYLDGANAYCAATQDLR